MICILHAMQVALASGLGVSKLEQDPCHKRVLASCLVAMRARGHAEMLLFSWRPTKTNLKLGM